MNSKREEKINKLKNELEPLINKVVFFDGNLYKIISYSTIFIYAYKFEKDKEKQIDEDVTFFTIGEFKYFRHFSNSVSNKKIKIKFSEFYPYKVLENIKNINEIYFKNDEVINNYYNSHFYIDEDILELKYFLKQLIISLNTHFLKLSDEYYYKIRIKFLKRIFYNNEELEEIKFLLDELTTEYKNLNYYDEYLKLYEEYKKLINDGKI